MDIVQPARLFAAEKHFNQRRKYSDAPYTEHLHNVVDLLEAYGHKQPHVLAAAWLHDTVEDTDATMQEIMETFGLEVAELVYWLTDAEQGNRKSRMQMSAWRLGLAPWDAKMIKLADIVDNGRNITEHDPGFATIFLAEKRQVLAQMLRAEGEPLKNDALFQHAIQLVLPSYDVVEPS
jgi:(p)ppGpp synthase/HD superfamily hydrolase